jgi:hypothetical protein
MRSALESFRATLCLSLAKVPNTRMYRPRASELGMISSKCAFATCVRPSDEGVGKQGMIIKLDDLNHPAIHTLLNEHLQNMHQLSPPESVHALNLEKLRAPEITFWTAWENDLLLGCGAPQRTDTDAR